MNQPLISVIVPTYNCARTIGTAIESLAKQTYKNLEILIIDDNSTDNTRDVIKQYSDTDNRVKYFILPEQDPNRFDKKLNRNVNAGYSARNFGFDQAKGDFITFQDADDASFLNRIETQYILLKKNSATHLSIDWVQFNEQCLDRQLNVETYIKENQNKITGPKELYEMSQRSKGLIAKISKALSRAVPFHFKRKRVVNKLFFGTLENYPGAGNSPLFKREVIKKVRFRKLADRVWPSFMGRGADRDFNFQVAETFNNSFVFHIPLYMWRVKTENIDYPQGVGGHLI